MTHSRIQTVVFDLGEVLVRLDFSQVMALRRLNPSGLEASITSMNHWPLYDAFERGNVSEIDFLNQLNQDLSTSLTLSQFRTLWNSVLGPTVPGIPSYLETLSQSYSLFALTNSNETHIRFFKENYPWVKNFKKVLTSFELGCRKPEAVIFEKMIEITQTPRDSILFLDDRLENVEGARSCGIPAELCKNSEQELAPILAKYQIVPVF